MSFKPLIALALVAGIAVPANAAMTVGTFLTRAAPLRANPLLALMSPDYQTLKAEADAAVRAHDDLDWTIVRPGGLTDDAGTGQVEIGENVEGSIPRADVAHLSGRPCAAAGVSGPRR